MALQATDKTVIKTTTTAQVALRHFSKSAAEITANVSFNDLKHLSAYSTSAYKLPVTD